MSTPSNALRKMTLSLSLFILIALSLSALGGFVELPQLAYCWYLALAGISLMLLMSVILAVVRLLHSLLERYHRMLNHWGDGVPGV